MSTIYLSIYLSFYGTYLLSLVLSLLLSQHRTHTLRCIEMEQRSATLGDATVSDTDLQYLSPRGWLNDRLISVWCEHVMRQAYGSNTNQSPISILLPNVTFFLHCMEHDDDDELKQIVKTYDLLNKQLIVAVINDSMKIEVTCDDKQASGSHWSLLVFDRRQSQFFHLDSLPSALNARVCDKVVSRLKTLLSLRNACLVTLEVPLQRNLFDCGKFLRLKFLRLKFLCFKSIFVKITNITTNTPHITYNSFFSFHFSSLKNTHTQILT